MILQLLAVSTLKYLLCCPFFNAVYYTVYYFILFVDALRNHYAHFTISQSQCKHSAEFSNQVL